MARLGPRTLREDQIEQRAAPALRAPRERVLESRSAMAAGRFRFDDVTHRAESRTVLDSGRDTTLNQDGPGLELDLGAERDGALAREAEVVGRLGRDQGRDQEDALAPAAHPRPIGRPELDPREVERRLASVDRALDPGLGDLPDQLRDVVLLGVAVLCAHEREAVVLVAEIVDLQPFLRPDAGNG